MLHIYYYRVLVLYDGRPRFCFRCARLASLRSRKNSAKLSRSSNTSLLLPSSSRAFLPLEDVRVRITSFRSAGCDFARGCGSGVTTFAPVNSLISVTAGTSWCILAFTAPSKLVKSWSIAAFISSDGASLQTSGILNAKGRFHDGVWGAGLILVEPG